MDASKVVAIAGDPLDRAIGSDCVSSANQTSDGNANKSNTVLKNGSMTPSHQQCESPCLTSVSEGSGSNAIVATKNTSEITGKRELQRQNSELGRAGICLLLRVESPPE